MTETKGRILKCGATSYSLDAREGSEKIGNLSLRDGKLKSEDKMRAKGKEWTFSQT